MPYNIVTLGAMTAANVGPSNPIALNWRSGRPVMLLWRVTCSISSVAIGDFTVQWTTHDIQLTTNSSIYPPTGSVTTSLPATTAVWSAISSTPYGNSPTSGSAGCSLHIEHDLPGTALAGDIPSFTGGGEAFQHELVEPHTDVGHSSRRRRMSPLDSGLPGAVRRGSLCRGTRASGGRKATGPANLLKRNTGRLHEQWIKSGKACARSRRQRRAGGIPKRWSPGSCRV